MVKISGIPAFDSNYIWLIFDDASRQAWVIDPGMSAPVLTYCQTNNLSLSGILITHHHPDHTGGITELLSHANIPVYGPKNEFIASVTDRLGGHDSLTLPIGTFHVLDVPGHTLGHIAYYSDTLLEHPVLFIGDTLFSAGCGRLFEGTASMMHHSISKVIGPLPDDTKIFCAHEYTEDNLAFAMTVEPTNPELQQYHKEVIRLRRAGKPTLPTTLSLEKTVNPFMRTTQTEVIKSTSAWAKQPLQTDLDVFTKLRQWKDNF